MKRFKARAALARAFLSTDLANFACPLLEVRPVPQPTFHQGTWAEFAEENREFQRAMD
jgi:hypothetical protein